MWAKILLIWCNPTFYKCCTTDKKSLMNINLVEQISSAASNENSLQEKHFIMKMFTLNIQNWTLTTSTASKSCIEKSATSDNKILPLTTSLEKVIKQEKLTFFLSSQLRKPTKLWASTWYGRGIMLNGFLISRLVTLITVCCLNLLHVYSAKVFLIRRREEMERLEVIERGKYYINIQEAFKPQTYFVAHHRW